MLFRSRLFQCLTVAVRPLRVDELAEVLAIRFDPGQLPQYHVDWKLDDAEEAVLSTCSSLISVVNVDGSPVVQFSHFSVKEFLTSDRLAKSTEDLSRFHVVPHSAHFILVQACLSVLLHLGDQVDKDTIKKFPFAQYAARHWVDHGRFEDVSSRIQDAMERLFDEDSPSFATWIWIYDVDYPFRQHMFEDRPPRPEASALYYASLCGFHNLVEHLIGNYRRDINARGGRHGSAVNAALLKRNMEIALLLLGQGADVNIMNADGFTPLYLASDRGHRDRVEFLLKHHADVNLMSGRTSEAPLTMAAVMGEIEVARVLLHHGASVDPRDNQGWTPLFVASRYGHLDIVRLLIQSRAAVDTPDNEDWTPLFVASRCGHLDIVRLLIQSRAAVDTPDNEDRTPLIVASRHGHLRIAQVLIDNGGAINAQDTGLSTPLHYASAEGHLSVVELLIEHHADVYRRNKDQQTPLHGAATDGRLDIARLLLKSRSSPNSQDNDGSTPLHTAARNGHLDLVKLLVESGADVNMRNRKNQIPLDEALASRERQVTRYLANHMGVTDPFDGMGIDPLDQAPDNLVPDATFTSVGIAKHRHPHGKPSLNSLHDACAQGSVEDVWSLLDQGADINGRNAKHETALLVALRKGKLEVAKVLIEYGADLNFRDKIGWTPLMLASQRGHRDVAKLLLDRGTDVNAKRDNLWTALHLASLNGHLEIVEFLLDRGADIHARNIDGRTPSGEASKRGERDIVRLLSGVKVKSPVVWILFVPLPPSRVILTPFLYSDFPPG